MGFVRQEQTLSKGHQTRSFCSRTMIFSVLNLEAIPFQTQLISGSQLEPKFRYEHLYIGTATSVEMGKVRSRHTTLNSCQTHSFCSRTMIFCVLNLESILFQTQLTSGSQLAPKQRYLRLKTGTDLVRRLQIETVRRYLPTYVTYSPLKQIGTYHCKQVGRYLPND